MEIRPAQIWRHKVREIDYEIIATNAGFQFSGCPVVEEIMEDEPLTIYRDVKTGAFWVRPTEEFTDGRFELVKEAV